MKKLTIEDCICVAKEHLGRCLSTICVDSRTKMEWECEYGHRWFAKYNCIQQGHWCPICYRSSTKNGLQKCRDMAIKNGGHCLASEYVNNRTKMEWKCARGHLWSACCYSIDYGSWCPYCIGKARLSISECKKLAESKGGQCMSSRYINVHTKYKWKCFEGHTWTASYSDVKKATWCPKCAFRESQKLLTTIISALFPKYCVLSEYRDFVWQKMSNGHKLSFDIYIPELKLAIERDGEQHFMPVQFGGMSLKKAKAAYLSSRDRKDGQPNLATETYRSQADI